MGLCVVASHVFGDAECTKALAEDGTGLGIEQEVVAVEPAHTPLSIGRERRKGKFRHLTGKEVQLELRLELGLWLWLELGLGLELELELELDYSCGYFCERSYAFSSYCGFGCGWSWSGDCG